MARTTITPERKQRVVDLYKKETTIADILKTTGIASPRTVYTILRNAKINFRPKLKGGTKRLIILEPDTQAIVKKEKNPSLFINKAIRYYTGKETKKRIECR